MAETKGFDIGKAFVQIVPSARGIKGSISDVLDGESKSAGKNGGMNIASGIKNMIIASGIGTAIAASINEGGKLQQSLGGIETLFKDSADKMKQYASQAFETAGLSANEYMEQATSFAASLVKSLGGDTEKAADAANQALIDMADNSNKMGTSMESIQFAYQGFARGNYTMLDNLKIGYSGTKQEMERLLADATKLTGIKYDISNLNDVYSAIHVIQEDLGITGTTAKEASTTFQGSFKAMASAAKNFIGNLSIGADIKEPLQSLVKTTTTFLVSNLVPMVVNIAKALPGAIGVLISSVIDLLPGSIDQVFNGLLDSISLRLPGLLIIGKNALRNFIDGFNAELPNMIATVGNMLNSVISFIVENLPSFITNAGIVITSFATGLIEAFPMILAQIKVFFINALGTIVENLPLIIDAAFNLITNFLGGLIESFPLVLAQIPQFVSDIGNAFMGYDWLGLGGQIISGIGKGIYNTVTSLVKTAVNACKSLVDGVKDFFGIHSPSRLMANEIGKYIPEGMAVGITRNLNVLDSAGKQMKMSVLDSVKDINGNNAFNSLKFNGFKANTSRNQLGGNINQTINITSPKALNPSEVARQTRNSTRNLLLQVQGG